MKATTNTINAAEALNELIRANGQDPTTIGSAELAELAQRLSEIAGRTKAWGWKYLRNVQHRTQQASAQLMDAILRAGALLDGLPADLARGSQVTVIARGTVRPGAIILADSQPCGYPACGRHFVPAHPRQKYHSTDCRTANKEWRKKQCKPTS